MLNITFRRLAQSTLSSVVSTLTLAGLLTTSAHASEFDVNISSDSANLQFNILPPTRDYDAGIGYIYRESRTHIANLDFHARGQTVLGNMPTTVGIGAQLHVFDHDDFNGSALGLGGLVHVKVPNVPGLGLRVSGHYAPSITAFGEADYLYRLDFRTTYRVIQNADIYAGYRHIRAGVEAGGDDSLDENFHLGFTLHF